MIDNIHEILDNGSGFAFIRDISYQDFIATTRSIGTLQVQNNENETVVSVKNRGGETLLCNAKDVYDEINKTEPHLIEVLSQYFYFDKKEYKPGEPKTLHKPILFNKEGHFCFRYLRDYVESGYNIEEKKLSDIQTLALDCLDKTIKNNTKKYKLEKNDARIFNNLRVFHGRLSYTDSEKLTRNLKRIWLCKH